MRGWHDDTDKGIESCGGYSVLSYLHVHMHRANFPFCPGVKNGR